jgi:hypothetical protein
MKEQNTIKFDEQKMKKNIKNDNKNCQQYF